MSNISSGNIELFRKMLAEGIGVYYKIFKPGLRILA
jgi:hypothetical protein